MHGQTNTDGLTGHGHTKAAPPTVHDQTTTGTGNTGSHGTFETSSTTGGSNTLGSNVAGATGSHTGGSTGLGRDTIGTTTGGNTDFGRDTTGTHTGGNTTLGRDTIGSNTGGNTDFRRDATGPAIGGDTTLGGATGATTTSHTTGHSTGLTSGADSTSRTGHTEHGGLSTERSGIASDTPGTPGISDTNRGRETTTDDSSSHKHHDPHEIQSPEQGPDPALVGDAKDHPKMTGQGTPGSHSAVFGLTPDGKKYDDSSSKTTAPAPAHSNETTLGRKSVAAGAAGADSGRDTVSGGHGGVSDQIDAPDVGKKGLERTDPAPTEEATSGGKPGAGLGGLSQGSGQV